MSASVFARCLSITNTTANFVTDEVWLTGEFRNTSWIEAGVAYGNPAGARRYYFWADTAPGRDYAEHDDTSDGQPTLGGESAEHDVEAVPADDYSYTVTPGPFSGATGGWPADFGFNTLLAGTETTNVNSTANYVGGSDNLVWDSKNNNFVAGWAYAGDSTIAHRSPSAWGFISTVSANFEYDHGVATSSC